MRSHIATFHPSPHSGSHSHITYWVHEGENLTTVSEGKAGSAPHRLPNYVTSFKLLPAPEDLSRDTLKANYRQQVYVIDKSCLFRSLA